MDLTKYFDRLQRLHRLISKKATGSPAELAHKLDLSERAIFEYIRMMRELGGPIAFCPVRRTYYYEREVQFHFGFHELNEKEVKEIDGGSIDIIAEPFTEFSRLH
jgi:predicted DNA-binding transcriptional regulator YafY